MSAMMETRLLVCLVAVWMTRVHQVHGQAQSFPALGRQGPKMIVLMLSGFRWDYLNYTNNGFRLMQEEGVKSYYVTPVFPSLSYPNMETFMTGLYTENHGISGDYMYDIQREEYFLGYPPDYSTGSSFWWEQAEPYWVRAIRGGLRVEMHWWPGCTVPIFQTRPEVCIPYKNSGIKLPQLAAKLSAILQSLQTGLSNVAFVYVDDILQIARAYGPTSREVVGVIQNADYILRLFQEEIKFRQMHNEVNVIVASDHGVSRVNPINEQRNIDLQSYISDVRDIDKIIDIGSVVGIYPGGGKVDLVYNAIKSKVIPGMKVFMPWEVPEHWQFRRSQYLPPILAVAESGYTITWSGDKTKLVSAKNPLWLSMDGYDPYVNLDMRAIFMARGPDFKQNQKTSPMEMTDAYNLMCAITGIHPHSNQGRWDNVREMLVQPPLAEALFAAAPSHGPLSNFVILATISLLLIIRCIHGL